MKKLIFNLLILSLCSSLFAKVKISYDSKVAVKDTGKVEFHDMNAIEIVEKMETGWNLGNTLDATGGRTLASETSWGMPKTTKEIIDGVAAAGFKTIRIPVSWQKHIIDGNFTIDPAWMSRVKEVVDWAIGAGMYVILNVHHDNSMPPMNGVIQGYYPDSKSSVESEKYIANIWSQIALAFNNGYDEHLVFETLNEPRLRGTDQEWSFTNGSALCLEAAAAINAMNQTALDVIRKSGGNNAKRFVMFPGYAATPAAVLSDSFVIPKDKVPGHILISVHMYTPFMFAGQSPGSKVFLPKMQNDLVNQFKKLNEKFVANGYGVVIGEYGAVNKDNLEERVKYFDTYIKFAKKYGLAACLWDNGKWKIKDDDYSERFGYYDRRERVWVFPEIVEAIMNNFTE